MLPLNHWYVVASSPQVSAKRPLALRRFGRDWVLWRNEAGQVQAVDDRCPHRSAKLSLGRIRDGQIECPYHGFRFDGAGDCTLAPCEGAGAKRSHLKNVAASLREEHGFIWQWHGEEAPSEGPLVWFDELKGPLPYNEFRETWKTSFARAVESQLDWAHLPFVHRNSIGIGFQEELEVKSRFEGGQIYTWPKHMETPQGDPSFYLRFQFPNYWMNPAGPGTYIFLAFVPVDEDEVELYVRSYQYLVKIPGLRELFGWVMGLANRFVIRQDRRVVESQPPEIADPDRPERLVSADLPITQFRKELRRSMRTSAGSALVPTQALLRPRDGSDEREDAA